eukprot:3608002-Prymnesium_polylepis.2
MHVRHVATTPSAQIARQRLDSPRRHAAQAVRAQLCGRGARDGAAVSCSAGASASSTAAESCAPSALRFRGMRCTMQTPLSWSAAAVPHES